MAVRRIGLPIFYRDDPRSRAETFLDAQRSWQKRYDLPVILRTRGARMTNWRCAKARDLPPNRRGATVLPAVCNKPKRFVRLGYKIGVSGAYLLRR